MPLDPADYMVDEILFQARIVRLARDLFAEGDRLLNSSHLQHPSLPAAYLAQPSKYMMMEAVHHQIRAVTLAAVAVDADAERFPDDWLFKFRWGKGKRKGKEVLFSLVRYLASSSPVLLAEPTDVHATSCSPTGPARPFLT